MRAFGSSLVLTLASTVATVASAQIPQRPHAPPGYFVSSSFRHEQLRPGSLGGLFLGHPRVFGAPVGVTGLGADLTGDGIAATPHGANSILIGSNHLWYVGEIGQPGVAIDLHEIAVLGSRVTRDRRIRLGVVAANSQFGGGVQQACELPGGEVLVCVADLAAPGPLAGAILGRVTPASGAVMRVAVTPAPPGRPLAVACDPAGTSAYFAVVEQTPLATSIYRVPLPTGGVPVRIARIPGRTFSGLVFDHRGKLMGSSGTGIVEIDPNLGTWSVVATLVGHSNGIAIESATGGVVYVLNGLNAAGPSAYRIAPASHRRLTNALGGVPTGIAMERNPTSYGVATDGVGRYRWRTAPNPGGIPRVGGSRFGVQVDGSGSPAAGGLLLLGLAPSNGSLLGIRVLLDLPTLVVVGPIGVGVMAPLPIPATPALTWARIYLQTVHPDAMGAFGLASSDGLEIVVLP